ncbi:MAG: hypothetical protein MJZ38_00320 [archaeon]|nr:hypothetical protein [archaeon]
MTDLYMDQPGSKKKYLIPLVVLLLCAVSLTGAGFAYSSEYTSNGAFSEKDQAVVYHMYSDAQAQTLDEAEITADITYDVQSYNDKGIITYTVAPEECTITKYVKVTSVGKDAVSGLMTFSANLTGDASTKYAYELTIDGNDMTGQKTAELEIGSVYAVVLKVTGFAQPMVKISAADFQTFQESLETSIAFNLTLKAAEIVSSS